MLEWMQVTLWHTYFIKIQRIARCNMNVSTMAAINSINTMNLMVALQLEANAIFLLTISKYWCQVKEKTINNKSKINFIWKDNEKVSQTVGRYDCISPCRV